MSFDVHAERVIPLPPTQVAGYAMDWLHDAEWMPGIQAVELSAPAEGGGFGVGAEVTRTSFFLGRRIDFILRVVVYEPPTLLRMRSIAGPFPMHVTYRFDQHPDGTLASIRVEGDLSGYYRVGAPVVRAAIRSNVRRNLGELSRNLS